ncbi:hypothetical protein B0H13DRAFT_2548860 [Mycena leptocephala]|nr:hypothetical protein B0H13DRAFT_2548860 [Mycena leptocephala]
MASVLVVGNGALEIQFASDITSVHPTKCGALLHSRARLLPRLGGGGLAVLQAPLALNVQAMLGEPMDLFSLSSPAPSFFRDDHGEVDDRALVLRPSQFPILLSMYTHGANIRDMTSLSRLSAHKIPASHFLCLRITVGKLASLDVDPDAEPARNSSAYEATFDFDSIAGCEEIESLVLLHDGSSPRLQLASPTTLLLQNGYERRAPPDLLENRCPVNSKQIPPLGFLASTRGAAPSTALRCRSGVVPASEDLKLRMDKRSKSVTAPSSDGLAQARSSQPPSA